MQAILECHEEKKQELQKAFTTNRIRGLPYMMSGKFWDLLTSIKMLVKSLLWWLMFACRTLN